MGGAQHCMNRLDFLAVLFGLAVGYALRTLRFNY